MPLTEPGGLRGDPRRLIAILRAVHMTHLIDFMIMMPLGSHFIRAFGMPASGLGALVFAYTVSAGIAGVVVGSVIDRFDRRRLLRIVYCGFLLSLLLTASAGSADALLGARLLAGTCGGVLSAMIQTIVADAVPPERRASALGRVMTGHALAAVLGVPLGLALASALGWRSVFAALALLSVVAAYGVARHVPALPHARELATSRADSVAAAFTARRSATAFALTFAVTFSAYAVVAYVAPYWVGNVGIAESELPLVYLGAGALSFFTSPLAGRLADRHGRCTVFALAMLLSAAAILLVTDAPRLPLGAALALGWVFFVVVYARWVPALALLSEVPAPASRGAFMMWNGVVTQLGMGAGALFTGSVIERAADGSLQGFDTVSYVAAAVSLIAIALGRLIADTRR